MNKISLIFVSSPLQTLMSIEAVKYYKIAESDVLLVFSDVNQINREAFFSVINFLKWPNYVYFPSNKLIGKDPFTLPRFKLGKIENLIVSGKGSIPFHYLNIKRRIIISDGIEILSRLNEFEVKNNNWSWKRLFPQTKEELFIPYPVNIDNSNIKFRQNTFRHIKSIDMMGGFKELEGYVLFIGGYYTEEVFGVRIFSFENNKYIQFMTSIVSFYKEKKLKVLYVPHHYESKDKLNALSEIGIEIFKNEGGIEVSLILQKIKPIEVAAFHSSALYQLKLIFPSISVRCFLLDLNLISKSHYKVFDAAFCFYRKQFKCYSFEKDLSIIKVGTDNRLSKFN